MNPNNPSGEIEMRAAQAAAHSLGQQCLSLGLATNARSTWRSQPWFKSGPNALVVASDALFFSRRNQLVSLAARHQIPAIYYLREFARLVV